jgi:trehalose synthase-fused probable maltokinase
LVVVDVAFSAGPDERYCIPLAIAQNRREGEARFGSVVCEAGPPSTEVFCDPSAGPAFAAALLDLIESRGRADGAAGQLAGIRGERFSELRSPDASLTPRAAGAEQSNTSVLYGDRLILKLFRRLEEGPNPDVEIGTYLTEKAGFAHAPAVAGAIEYRRAGRPAASVGLLQSLVANRGDAWTHALTMLDGYFQQLPAGSDVASAKNIELAGRLVESYRPDAELLGRRTAELHLALAGAALDPDFQPEPFDTAAAAALCNAGKRELRDTLAQLASRRDRLSAGAAALAGRVLAGQSKLTQLFEAVLSRPIAGQKIRCHGDYHLGQVLFTGADFVILDFEGEPARPLAERRAKQSPLKDVAGMLRSFDYAVAVAVRNAQAGKPALDAGLLAVWARPWRERVCAKFLGGYRNELRGASFVPAAPAEFSLLLDAHVLEKAVYELRYELNNRPAWVEIPLGAIAELAQ